GPTVSPLIARWHPGAAPASARPGPSPPPAAAAAPLARTMMTLLPFSQRILTAVPRTFSSAIAGVALHLSHSVCIGELHGSPRALWARQYRGSQRPRTTARRSDGAEEKMNEGGRQTRHRGW